VLYSELLVIQEDSTKQYYMKLEDELEQRSRHQVDLNAGDGGSLFEFQKFQYRSLIENEHHAGDVILLQHVDTSDLIAVSEKKILQYVGTRTCWINNTLEEITAYSNQENFTLRQLELAKVQSKDNFELLLDHLPHTEEDPRVLKIASE
jgi:hypothetical protein